MKTQYMKEHFLLGRITFIFSILQKRHSIFKEFLLGRKIKIFFFFKSAKLFIKVSKINQGSCLGCLGGDDAPEYYVTFFYYLSGSPDSLRLEMSL